MGSDLEKRGALQLKARGVELGAGIERCPKQKKQLGT